MEAAVELGTANIADHTMEVRQSRLFFLMGLIDRCSALYDKDKALRPTVALSLGHLHLAVHEILKLDDNAKDEIVSRFRQHHPAASRASEPVGIYDLNRAP
jgi:hypothetical protein